jgi:hypothetical protein
MFMGGCGVGTSEEEGSNPTLSGEELNGAAGGDPSGKITICHVPPGNPANAHTLVVGASAWKGHSRHPGDHLGACEGQGTPDAGTPPDGDGGTSTPPDGGTGTPPPPPDGGTPDPVCAPEGAACGGAVNCCGGLSCQDGYCLGVIG